MLEPFHNQVEKRSAFYRRAKGQGIGPVAFPAIFIPDYKPTRHITEIPDEDYEKIIVKKYLDGNITRKTMNNMLKMFEDTNTKRHHNETIAYG